MFFPSHFFVWGRAGGVRDVLGKVAGAGIAIGLGGTKGEFEQGACQGPARLERQEGGPASKERAVCCWAQQGGDAAAWASPRNKSVASDPNLPPTSSPSTINRQRRLPLNSGYVTWRFRSAARRIASPGRVAASWRTWPVRPSGVFISLDMVDPAENLMAMSEMKLLNFNWFNWATWVVFTVAESGF